MDDNLAAKTYFRIVEGLQRHGLSPEVEELEPLVNQVHDSQLHGQIAHLLGFYWLRRGIYAKALRYSEVAASLLPGDAGCVYNAVFSLLHLGRLDEGVALAQRALRDGDDNFDLHNILAAMLGAQGRLPEAHAHGTRALELKDRLTAGISGRDLSASPVPVFDPGQPARNIISFSLFGADSRYLDGALSNAEAAKYIYPGWTCRFYIDDSVPKATLTSLAGRGAQVMQLRNLPARSWGTLWRFLVADDPHIDRFLVRDADSVVNLREAVAVQEWLTSGRHFHLMRDHFDHTELVLAGMWGGVRGALPNVMQTASAFLNRASNVAKYTADQEFLREALWPTIRQSVLAHDSQFSFGEPRDFPPHAVLPPGCYVGGRAQTLLTIGRQKRDVGLTPSA